MIREAGKWVGERKYAKFTLTIAGALAIFFGSLKFGTNEGGILFASGIVMEVGNVYAISVVTEEARREIEHNRSEIEETYNEMKELSKEIEETSEEAVYAREEAEEIKREIERDARGGGRGKYPYK